MRTLDRYIARNVIASTFTVLVTLLAIFTFFALIEELENVGRGSFGILQVIIFVLLSVPGLTYELFPMAALIGSLLALGAMVRNGELAVVRCAGVSKLRIVFSVMKAGTLLVLVAVFVGEVIAPPAQSFARQYRSLAINDRIALKTQNGYWARDGESFINIRQVLPGDRLQDIYIYEFDENGELRMSTHAEQARFKDGRWILEGIAQTEISQAEVLKREIEIAGWDSLLRPDLIAMVAIQPDNLSIWTLIKYIRFLRTNGQAAQRYEHAMWVKLTYPLASGVMVFLAIPMVLKARQAASVGQRVLVGGLIGLGFHLLNQAAGHVGIVYDITPAISAAGPTIAMALIGLILLTRTA